MSDDFRGSGADGVEEGKRLIRLGGDRGLSLADRIAERLQRLTWRTPIHTMRLKGRHPLKLIAVADDPFLGDLARGNALLDGIVQFRGEERAVTALDFARANWSKPFGDHLHSFAWLRDLSSVATRAQGAPVAEAILQSWLAAHADKVSDPAWRPDLWGRRILFWTAHAPLILSSQDLVYRSTVLHALARGARHLDRSADRAALGPPRLAAWCGVLVAGLMIPGGDPRRAFGETGLKRTLDMLVTSDGGTLGRSPAGQLDCVMLLTMLCGSYAARRIDPPAFIQSALNRMVTALLGVCHGDRGLSSWQGSAPIPGDVIAQVIEGSGVRTRPLRQAREWGYQRLAAGGTVLILDAAPPPARMMEGGCASTLAFELSEGAQRLVVNCGGSRMAHSGVPAALTEGLRTTAAHSTLVIGDSNSTAIHPDGTLGRGVAEVELSRQESENASRIEASHDGYARRFGFIHRRQIALAADGRDVRGEDMLLPVGRRQKKKGATSFAVRFHLAPHIEVAPTADGLAAFLKCPGGVVWQFRCRGGTLAVEDSVWLDGQGRPHGTAQLVIAAETPAGGTNVSWVFHRAK